MALIKMAHIVAEVRGSIGGTVFSRNTYGAYMREKVTPINPSTVSQQAQRQQIASFSQAWRGLTAAQRLQWNAVAKDYSRTNIFGDGVPLTGFNLYIRLNKNLWQINEAAIALPTQPLAVTGFVTFSFVANTTAGTMVLTFTDAIPATQKVIVRATSPQSAGKDFVKSEYRVIDILTTADLTGEDVAAAYITKFGALPPIGSKIFIQLVPVVIANGQQGLAITDSKIAV